MIAPFDMCALPIFRPPRMAQPIPGNDDMIASPIPAKAQMHGMDIRYGNPFIIRGIRAMSNKIADIFRL
jgi:hypothetical protein